MNVDLEQYFSAKSLHAPDETEYPNITLAGRGFFVQKIDGFSDSELLYKKKDSLAAEGQKISIPEGRYSRLIVDGFSMYGDYAGYFTFLNKDDVTGKAYVGLNNFQSDRNMFQNTALLESNVMVDQKGMLQQSKNKIWRTKIKLKNIHVTDLVLFDNPFFIILKIVME